VLGLPLAFILSQDQTLRCNKNGVLISQNNLLSLTFKGNLLFRLLFQSLKELLHLTIVKLLFVWVGKDRKTIRSNNT
jgi:hypothetical protein